MSESEPQQQRDDPLDAIEAEERGVANRLYDDRPFPSPYFRGELGRRLAATDPGRGSYAGVAVTRLIAGCLSGGVILLAIAAAGVAGVGPFAT